MSKRTIGEYLAEVKERYEKVKKIPVSIEGHQKRLFLYLRLSTDAETLVEMVEVLIRAVEPMPLIGTPDDAHEALGDLEALVPKEKA